MPAVGFEPLEDVFSERDFGVAVCSTSVRNTDEDVRFLTDGDMIIVIDSDQVAELQMTSKTSSFAGDALLGTTISKECVGMIID
jgi:hypothetical protein